MNLNKIFNINNLKLKKMEREIKKKESTAKQIVFLAGGFFLFSALGNLIMKPPIPQKTT